MRLIKEERGFPDSAPVTITPTISSLEQIGGTYASLRKFRKVLREIDSNEGLEEFEDPSCLYLRINPNGGYDLSLQKEKEFVPIATIDIVPKEAPKYPTIT